MLALRLESLKFKSLSELEAIKLGSSFGLFAWSGVKWHHKRERRGRQLTHIRCSASFDVGEKLPVAVWENYWNFFQLKRRVERSEVKFYDCAVIKAKKAAKEAIHDRRYHCAEASFDSEQLECSRQQHFGESQTLWRRTHSRTSQMTSKW